MQSLWKSAKHSKTTQLSATDVFCSGFHACECEQLCLLFYFAKVFAAPIYHEMARLKTNVVFGLRTPFRTHQNVPITDSPPLPSAYEPLSELLVSPLITPIIPPYIISYITPSRFIGYSSYKVARRTAIFSSELLVLPV